MAVTINFYDSFMKYVGDGGIDLGDDSFKITLMTTTHAFDQTDTDWGGLQSGTTDVSANEIPTGNGYDQNTKVLASVTWLEAAGVATFDANDVTWTASGGSIPTSGDCGDAVIFSDTSTAPVADLLMCSIDFDGAQSAGVGTDFKITFNAAGIFTVT